MALAPYRLRPLASLPAPALQPLVEAVLGVGERAPGWLARKRAREAVDPRRSLLAFGPGDTPVAYLLICVEPGEPTAYSSGLGVLPEQRGRGLARALLARAAAELHELGLQTLQMTAEPPLRGFYERLGFVAGPTRHTLRCAAHGPGLDLRLHPPAPWPLPGRPVAGWRAGTWSRTPGDDAATLALAGGLGSAHLSREGRALLVQRLCVTGSDDPTIVAHAHAALDDLRARAAEGTPLLLYGAEAVSCVTASLLQRGPWHVAQTGLEMHLRLAAMDKHAGPAA